MGEFETMVAVGLIPDPHRWELYDGQLWEKMPQKSPHVWGVTLAFRAMAKIFGLENVNQQMPVHFEGRDSPEPDVVVMRNYSDHPTAGQVLLVIEVSDTSLADDLGRKAAVYARHGVSEYWVLDLNRRGLVVHRGPRGEGWGEIARLSETERVAPLAAPDRAVSVASLLARPDLDR